MADFFNMAKRGTIYTFGNGSLQSNPIHGLDLADFIADNLESSPIELPIGGPDILTQDQIATLAFQALNKPPKIRHVPIIIPKLLAPTIRLLTPVKTHGPIEFFLTVLTQNMIAPQTGTHHLADHFNKLAQTGS